MNTKGCMLSLLLLASIVQADLVAEWNFNEGVGGTAYDSTLNANDCTINNATWSTGVSGGALDFNGFDSYLNCGNSSSLNFGTGNFTILAWVKTTTGGNIVFKLDQTGTLSGYYTTIQDSNVYSSLEDLEYWSDYQSSINITTGAWRHIAVVRTGTNSTKIYVDGAEDTGAVQASCETCEDVTDVGSIADFILSENNYATAYNGSIDELKVYDTALNDLQILSIYNSEKPSATGGYIAKYTSSEVGDVAQDTVGSLFDALAQQVQIIVIIVIGLFAIGSLVAINFKLRSLR